MSDPPRPIRLLICDDHFFVRAGLRAKFSTVPGFEVVAEAANGPEAIAAAARHAPDVVTMDLSMPAAPEVQGLDAIAAIASQSPDTGFVVLTSHDTQADVLKAIALGAKGFVLKDGQPEELLEAIRKVAEGGSHITPDAASRLVDQLGAKRDRMLTPRETEVLQLVANGATAYAIGTQLGISEKTVKAHLTSTFAKLGTGDRTGAVVTALRRGIIRLEE